jgi:hypothetical protein
MRISVGEATTTMRSKGISKSWASFGSFKPLSTLGDLLSTAERAAALLSSAARKVANAVSHLIRLTDRLRLEARKGEAQGQ